MKLKEDFFQRSRPEYGAQWCVFRLRGFSAQWKVSSLGSIGPLWPLVQFPGL